MEIDIIRVKNPLDFTASIRLEYKIDFVASYAYFFCNFFKYDWQDIMKNTTDAKHAYDHIHKI